VLVIVVGAAAALLLSAPALGAGVLTTELPAITGNGAQQSAAIAVDPDNPLLAAVVADDGIFAPPNPRTATAAATDWSSAVTQVPAPSHSGSTSAGQPDIAWGIDNPSSGQGSASENVYLVEEGSLGGSLCNGFNSGLFFSSSADGGQQWSLALPVGSGSTSAESIEPAIAVDRSNGRLYIAYTRLDYPTTGCSGAPDSSQIFLSYSNNGGGSWLSRRVSPIATSGSAHYRSPSLAVLPDGRVIIAFRNDASGMIETETCVTPTPPSGNYCGSSAGFVGPSTVVGDATSPGLVSGVAGPPTPSVVAAGGRVTVAWHAAAGGAVRAFAAMSTDSGATFGPPQQIDPLGGGNQIAPRLAATVDGRVDVAYLWDVLGSGVVSATSASAGPPLPGATTEAWGNPVNVQAVGASATTGIPGLAPLGRRLGIATANAISPLPATVIAFTDTSSATAGQDVHVVGLLHGTSAPVIPTQTVTASKNIPTIVHVNGTDADGDPLTWSTGAQPNTPGSSVSTADQARGQFTFNAANKVTTDTFEAIATDGVPGHEARAIINVDVVNDKPKITCSVLITKVNTPVAVKVPDCAADPNHDPVSLELDEAKNGTVERVAGIWYFVPKPNSTATGSFTLHASDPDDAQADPATVLVTVTSVSSPVNFDMPLHDKTRVIATGMSLRMAGSAVDAEGVEAPIAWNFGDHSAVVIGTKVAHRFRTARTFVVTATAASGTAASVTRRLTVIVRRRAVEIVGTPSVADGVLQVTVRTRAAGTLLLKADSRSQPLRVPAGLTQQVLRIQVTTGPLVRLTLRLTPSNKSPKLLVFAVRRLVMVSPRSAG
jgi:hypothetical protein